MGEAGGEVTDTIECGTCGGSGVIRKECKCRGEFHTCAPPFTDVKCPDCVNGRQPSRDVLERMARGIDVFEVFTAGDGMPGIRPRDPKEIALAAWLAEHRKDET